MQQKTQDKSKNKEQLASELADARKRIAELEEFEPGQGHAEEQFRTSDADYRAIFDTANDAIFVHDIRTGDILDVNRKMCEMYGYTREQALRLNVEALSSAEPPYTQEHAIGWIRKAVKGEPQLFEWMAKDKHGRLFWVEVSLQRIVIGGKDKLLATVRDITERKQAEQKIKQSEKRYRELYEGSRDGYSVVSMEGKILEFNSVCKEMLGYTEEELLEKTYRDITPPKWHALEAEMVESQVMTRGYSDVYEKELMRKDGTIFPIEIRAYLIKGDDGKPAAMWAFLRDITERKKAEQKIRESEKRYRELYEGSRDGYAMVNMDGRIIESNSVFREMLGYTEEELLEKTYEEITPEKWHAMEAGIIENQVMKRGYSDVYAKECRRKDGTIFPIEIRAYLIKDEDGEPVGMWAFVRDITERKRAEEELREAKDNLEIRVKERTEELRKKNEELERFVYCASHDLQAPLRAIQVFSKMLIDALGEQLESEHLEKLMAMGRTAENSGQLIGDMLTYARLGLQSIEKTVIPLKSVLNYCQFELIEDINRTNAEIRISKSLPTVKGDERMLVRLITNLLSNAIKFVPPDRRPLIEIIVKRANETVHFSVKDNGVGIAPEFRESVFGMFERLHSRDEYDGTGVGLAIAKKIVELHGGTIGVESEPGVGSTFWFEIPD